MDYKTILAEVREEVAYDFGYKIELPTYWDYAMTMTNRTKEQLLLYDEVTKKVFLKCSKTATTSGTN